jgi:hypothetical protein
MKKIIFLLAFNFLFIALSHAQVVTDSTSSQKKSVVTLYSGEQIIGTILSDDGREILIISDNVGKLFISKANIKTIAELKGDLKITEEGTTITEGPFTTRYSFTTNALPIKKNVNYAMINLFGPEVHFAVTNNLSLGVMSTWIASPLAVVGKYTFESKKENVHFAVGAMAGTSGYLKQAQINGGLGWGILTIGNRLDNVTISAGYGFVSNSSSNLNPFLSGPIASIAGITKIGEKTSLFFDSMFSYNTRTNETWQYYGKVDIYGNPIDELKKELTENYTLVLMPGVRFQSTDKKAFQVSLAGVITQRGNNTISFPVPMCSWFYKL